MFFFNDICCILVLISLNFVPSGSFMGLHLTIHVRQHRLLGGALVQNGRKAITLTKYGLVPLCI